MTQTIELITVLKELHTISGFRTSIYNTELQEVCSYPKELTGFCSYVQESKSGRQCCKDCDAKAFHTVKKTGEAYIYRCHFGLYEAVAPLYYFGVLSGYLMMGQTLDNSPDSRSHVEQSAREHVSDYERLTQAITDIPISSKDKIASCITIMKICASYITMINGWKAPDQELPVRIQKYINQHYASPITIDSLSSVFLCSKSTLSSAFRSTFQKTMIEYLTEVRLTHAKELLDSPAMSIKSISIACGFTDQNYFTKVFQKHFHMTPSDYRKHSRYSREILSSDASPNTIS